MKNKEKESTQWGLL